jgi:RNA polymerase sigma-70 factor (ECF subfamily)
VGLDEAAKDRWIATHILPHEGEVRSWLLRHVRTFTAADVDDLIQEAYARLWASDMPQLENGRAYFFVVARNLAFEQARRARIVPMERMGEIESLRIMSEAPGPEQTATARQELENLRAILEQLPPQCRRTFQLRKFDGLSIRDTAKHLGVSESTVEKHLTKAFAIILDALGTAASNRSTETGRPRGRENTHED